MTTRLYNTLAHEIQPFTPLHPGPDPQNPLKGATILMYTCGPTVYDFAHIGNFRAFLFADLLHRYLEFRGATVRQVMNMTDVGHMVDDTHADAQGEDKMQKAQERMKESKNRGGRRSKIPMTRTRWRNILSMHFWPICGRLAGGGGAGA